MVKDTLEYLQNHVTSGNVLILVPENLRTILFNGIELSIPSSKHRKTFKITANNLTISVESKEPSKIKQLDNLIVVGKVKFSESLLTNVKNKGRVLLIP